LNAAGETLGSISGVAVGVGDLLYLGRNGAVRIVQVKKSDGSFIQDFASPGGSRDEGLECDAVSFAPLLTLWSRDFYGFLSAIEIEEGSCSCGSPVIEVPFDIKPTSCPNPINMKGRGVLPAALLGTDSFDVTQVDPATIELFNPEVGQDVTVSPLRVNFEDVSTPYEPFLGKMGCLDCTTEGPDGFMDLTMKFEKTEVRSKLIPDDLEKGDCLVLQVKGFFLDGTAFLGEDVLKIV
jgi:hypothetical protein